MSRYIRIPAHVSRVAVMGVMGSVVALTAFVTYQRVMNRNPMRLKRDVDGIWRWLTMEQYLEEQCRLSKQRLAADPESEAALRACAAYAVALHEERRLLQAEGKSVTKEEPPLTL